MVTSKVLKVFLQHIEDHLLGPFKLVQKPIYNPDGFSTRSKYSISKNSKIYNSIDKLPTGWVLVEWYRSGLEIPETSIRASRFKMESPIHELKTAPFTATSMEVSINIFSNSPEILELLEEYLMINKDYTNSFMYDLGIDNTTNDFTCSNSLINFTGLETVDIESSGSISKLSLTYKLNFVISYATGDSTTDPNTGEVLHGLHPGILDENGIILSIKDSIYHDTDDGIDLISESIING